MQEDNFYPSRRKVIGTKISFLFFWVLAHIVGGRIAFNIADSIIRNNLFWGISAPIASAVFETILVYAKYQVFKRYKGLSIVMLYEGTDVFASLIALFSSVLLAMLKEDKTTTFSQVSISLITWTGIVTTFILMFSLIRSFAKNIKRKPKEKKTETIQFIAPPFETVARLFSYFLPIIRKGITFLAIILYLLSPIWVLALFIVPVKFFSTAFETHPLEIRNALFSISSFGWIGILTGIMYIISPLSLPKEFTSPPKRVILRPRDHH